MTSRALPQLEEDARLLPMLSGLSKRYLGQDYANKKPVSGSISAGQIDGVKPCLASTLHFARRIPDARCPVNLLSIYSLLLANY